MLMDEQELKESDTDDVQSEMDKNLSTIEPPRRTTTTWC